MNRLRPWRAALLLATLGVAVGCGESDRSPPGSRLGDIAYVGVDHPGTRSEMRVTLVLEKETFRLWLWSVNPMRGDTEYGSGTWQSQSDGLVLTFSQCVYPEVPREQILPKTADGLSLSLLMTDLDGKLFVRAKLLLRPAAGGADASSTTR